MERSIPPGDFLLDACLRVDFFSVSISEPQEDVVGSKCDTLRSSEYDGSFVDLMKDQVKPGVNFLVVHLDLVGACD